MPIVRRNQGTPVTPTDNTQQASTPPGGFSPLEQLVVGGSTPPPPPSMFQSLRNMLGAGTRLVGGFFANAGGPLGAAVGAGTELGAEIVEGSWDSTTPGRMAVEAAIGAIPLGKTIRAGKSLASMGLSGLKSAGFNVAGDLGRQVAEQYDPTSGKGVMAELGETDINWDRAKVAAALGLPIGAIAGRLAPTESAIPGLKYAGEAPSAPPVSSIKPEVVANSGEKLRRANVAKTGSRPGDLATPVYNRSGAGGPDPSQPMDMFTRPAGMGVTRVPYGGGVMGELSDPGVKATRSKPRATSNTPKDDYVSDVWDAAQQENRIRGLADTLGVANQIPRASRAMTVNESVVNKAAQTAQKDADYNELASRLGVEFSDDAASATRRTSSGDGAESITQRWTNDVDEDAIPSARRVGVQEDPDGGPGIPLYQIIGGPSHGSTVSGQKLKQLGILNPDEAAIHEARVGPLGFGDDPAHATRRGPLGIGDNSDTIAQQGRMGPVGSGATADEIIAQARRGPLGSTADDIAAQAAMGPVGKYPPKFPLGPGEDPDEAGLQSLIDFLGVDAAYGARKASGESTANLGDVFGRTQARAKELNAPKGGPPKKGSTVTLGAGLGGAQDVLRIAQENPEFAATVVGGVAGGAADMMMGDDSNPIEGILAGAGIAGGASIAPRVLERFNIPQSALGSPEGIRTAAKAIVEQLPFYQRASYLYDLRGLPANVFAGPYGSMMTGAIEAGLSGDPRGWELLRRAWNPLEFYRTWKDSFGEAADLLRRGELGRAEGIDLELPTALPRGLEDIKKYWKTGLAGPGVAMTMGDVAARRFLQEAGFSLDEARRMTLTSDPATEIGDWLAHGGGKSTLLNVLFPFRRTPVNIAEQGAQRIGGSLINKLMDNTDQSWREVGVQTAGGALTGTAGYQIGQELDDPRSSAQNMAARTATNLGGRYSLPVALGMLLGRTTGQGKNLTARDMQRGAETAVPLPQSGQLADSAYYLASKLGLTGNDNPRPPRGLVPFQHLMSNEEPPQLTNLSRIRWRQ